LKTAGPGDEGFFSVEDMIRVIDDRRFVTRHKIAVADPAAT
jgi:hypothetical protein